MEVNRKIENKVLDSEWFEIKMFYSMPQDFSVQLSRLWNENFGAGSGRSELELIEDKNRFCSEPYAYLLAVEKNHVIGATRLFKRGIDYARKGIILGGFGGLCTKKGKRRMGVATDLLKERH